MSFIKTTVHAEGLEKVKAKLTRAATEAEHIVALQIAKDTSPFVPALTGSLDRLTRVDGGLIIYPGPYARYLYYGKVMVNAATGKGPRRFIDKRGNEVVRFPYGSKLVATSRDLKYSKSPHRQAQSHWFEASKAKNLEKWERTAAEAVTNELNKK